VNANAQRTLLDSAAQHSSDARTLRDLLKTAAPPVSVRPKLMAQAKHLEGLARELRRMAGVGTKRKSTHG